MTAASIIARVRSLGSALFTDGARLVVDAPCGVITQELREEILRLKPAIVAELSAGAHRPFGDTRQRNAVHQIAGLLAVAYRRHQVAYTEGGESVTSSGSRLANSRRQSVHGGGS